MTEIVTLTTTVIVDAPKRRVQERLKAHRHCEFRLRQDKDGMYFNSMERRVVVVDRDKVVKLTSTDK